MMPLGDWFELTRPDTRPGISRESLPLADFSDLTHLGEGSKGVRDDWYSLWEA